MRVLRQCRRLALYLSIPSESPFTWLVFEGRFAHLMVLPVRRRIHCGMGRFCFCALASLTFVRKVLWDYRCVSDLMVDSERRWRDVQASWLSRCFSYV